MQLASSIPTSQVVDNIEATITAAYQWEAVVIILVAAAIMAISLLSFLFSKT